MANFENKLINLLKSVLEDVYQDEDENVTTFANRMIIIGNKFMLKYKSSNSPNCQWFRKQIENIFIDHFYKAVKLEIALELNLGNTFKESVNNAVIIETDLKFKIQCQLCKKIGHSADKCYLRIKRQYNINIVCQLCNKTGHSANQCYNKTLKCQLCNNFGHSAKQCFKFNPTVEDAKNNFQFKNHSHSNNSIKSIKYIAPNLSRDCQDHEIERTSLPNYNNLKIKQSNPLEYLQNKKQSDLKHVHHLDNLTSNQPTENFISNDHFITDESINFNEYENCKPNNFHTNSSLDNSSSSDQTNTIQITNLKVNNLLISNSENIKTDFVNSEILSSSSLSRTVQCSTINTESDNLEKSTNNTDAPNLCKKDSSQESTLNKVNLVNVSYSSYIKSLNINLPYLSLNTNSYQSSNFDPFHLKKSIYNLKGSHDQKISVYVLLYFLINDVIQNLIKHATNGQLNADLKILPS